MFIFQLAIAQAVKYFAPEGLKILETALGTVIQKAGPEAANLGTEAATTISQTLSDAGWYKSLVEGKTELGSNLHGLLNQLYSKADSEQRESIDTIMQLLASDKVQIDDNERLKLTQDLTEALHNISSDSVHASDNTTIPTKTKGSSDIPEAEQTTTGKVYTQTELDAEVEKKVEAELKKRVVENREAGTKNLDPIEKIKTGIGGVVTGEFKNMNSEVGWLMKAFCKWKGITINEEVVGNYLRGFANDTFQNNLKTFIKAKVSGHEDPLSLCTGLSENDKTSIKWAGTLITIGGSTPAWVFDGVALLGTAIDYGAEFMHGIPVLGTILKFPFGRKLITGVGQFAGRFAKDIQLIGTGARELKASGVA